MIRIYAVADVHGKSHRIEAVCTNVEAYAPDVLVLAGDITGLFKARGVMEQFAGLCPRVFFVRGNSDRGIIEKRLTAIAGIQSLHNQRYEYKGVLFSGLGGTIPVPFRSRIAFNEKELFQQLPPMDQRPSVFVAHPPPWQVLDEVLGKFHAGCRRLRGHVLRYRPDVLLCGHIHERPGTAVLGQTVVVNCSVGKMGNGAIVDISDAGKTTISLI